MGSIPLATVLNANGVLFAGIMGFIYSDLMVPPLGRVNASYYGWRVALYIAGIMYVSIVATALLLSGAFEFLGIVPESDRAVSEVAQLAIDYTFWFNLLLVAVAGWLLWHRWRWLRVDADDESGMEGDVTVKRIVAWCAAALLAGGMIAFAITA